MTLRLGIIAPQFPPEIGGMQTYACETVKELVRRGYAVSVLTHSHEEGETVIPDVKVLPVLRGVLDQDREQILRMATQVDCWHVMNAAWVWVALHVSPVVLTIHGNDFLDPNPVGGYRFHERYNLPYGSRPELLLTRWNTRRLLRKALPRLRHIIANSELTRTVFMQRFPDCPVQVSVGNVGVGDRFFEGRLDPREESAGIRLITVARLSEPRKNVDRVLEALGELKDRFSFTYTIVGDGIEKPRLEALAQNLGIAARVKFIGVMSIDELVNAYRSHDLFVLTPSAQENSVEGFGIVYLEANACGLPVLATRHCGAAPFIERYGSGILIDGPEVEAIGDAIQKIITGETAFRAEACRSCAEQFRWRKIIDHTVSCYAGGEDKSNR